MKASEANNSDTLPSQASSIMSRSPTQGFPLQWSFPSPPPPPQQRRASLTMSLPVLENLLSTAPPADLQRGSTSSPAQHHLRARRSHFRTGSMISAHEAMQMQLPPLIRMTPPDLPLSVAAALPAMRRSSPRLATAVHTKKKAPPSSLEEQPSPKRKRRSLNNSKLPAVTESCCICMSPPSPSDLASITGCAHRFCFGCIQEWSKTENSCPLCKSRFQSISRVHVAGPVKRVKARNQRSETGVALEGLLASLAGGNHHHLGRFLLRSLGEDNDPFLPGFMNVILRSTVTTHHTLAATLQLPSNMATATTGGTSAETAIEIDSDDDDDVQVL